MQRSAKTRKLGVVFCPAILFFSFACSVNQTPGTWVLLGTQQFDERTDMGVIPMGPMEGAFSRLRFELSCLLEINWVRVYFEDGENWSPNRDFNIRQGPGARSVVIDLPDEDKAIDRIEFRCILPAFDGFQAQRQAFVKVFGWKKG
jgi:hypothetical protein